VKALFHERNLASTEVVGLSNLVEQVVVNTEIVRALCHERNLASIEVVGLSNLVEQVVANTVVVKALYLESNLEVVGLSTTVGSASASTEDVDYYIRSLRSLQPQAFLLLSRVQLVAGTRLALADPLVLWEPPTVLFS
jgi:hypothetical protein